MDIKPSQQSDIAFETEIPGRLKISIPLTGGLKTGRSSSRSSSSRIAYRSRQV
jgi:hypothetical protein